jgi:hypothetical protein
MQSVPRIISSALKAVLVSKNTVRIQPCLALQPSGHDVTVAVWAGSRGDVGCTAQTHFRGRREGAGPTFLALEWVCAVIYHRNGGWIRVKVVLTRFFRVAKLTSPRAVKLARDAAPEQMV